MRTTIQECRQLGEIIASKLNRSQGPTTLFIPLKGISAIAIEGQPFFDPEADAALFESLRTHVDPSKVDLRELDYSINDPEFAEAMATRLLELLANEQT
jgi:uncharacterized protein (UPF0261 family)